MRFTRQFSSTLWTWEKRSLTVGKNLLTQKRDNYTNKVLLLIYQVSHFATFIFSKFFQLEWITWKKCQIVLMFIQILYSNPWLTNSYGTCKMGYLFWIRINYLEKMPDCPYVHKILYSNRWPTNSYGTCKMRYLFWTRINYLEKTS